MQNVDPRQKSLLDRPSFTKQLQHNFGDENEREKKARGREREMSREERERIRRERPIRAVRRAAFFSFTSLTSTQVAQQTLQAEDPVCMARPHVDDIDWDNIGIHYRTRAIGTLRHTLPFLNRDCDEYTILQDIFKQIAPLALVALSAPIVFNFVSEREGHPSKTKVRAALFTKLAYFQLFKTFSVTVIHTSTVDVFFISYVIVQTGLGFVLELLRVVLLLLSALFALLAPKHTRRERNTPWLVLRDIRRILLTLPTLSLTLFWFCSSP
ncbi:hypothetical protein PsorP6_016172 [Peronosclerospora sorghi]|uniref:Uncharacterized protein n=1 Tax=Peronosclerospora sorghi TaxID=230839 RepID=A0ACC0VLR9_9STRA|nr:hypothetical protein PsorP6_016172 [Peronosclerospora sorghi]